MAFEVTSVEPSEREGRMNFLPGGQTFHTAGITLRSLIWVIDKELFAIEAKAERPSSSDELHEIVYTMLADRFRLRFHRETKTTNVLALVVVKPGTLKLSEGGDPLDIYPIKPVGALRFKSASSLRGSLRDRAGGLPSAPAAQ